MQCLDTGNYQAASKITLMQNKMKQSMIYQLKALQNIGKYHPKAAHGGDRQEMSNGMKTPRSELMTPESEIHLFTVQGGQEEMCEDSQSQEISNSEDELELNGESVVPLTNSTILEI